MSIRSVITNFVYDHLEFYTDYVFRNGEDAEYLGIKLLDEPEKFVKGALINNAVHLFVHYRKTGDARERQALERLRFSVRILENDTLKTWGKFGALRGMCILKKEGLLDCLTLEEQNIIRDRTDYSDFYDKEKGVLKGAPTNYYQVAMACAGLREELGWENDGYCEIIKDKLLSVMSGFSKDGWMDEQPPYGRFDRYSMMISAELIDTLDLIGKEIPEFALKNLRDCANLALACANPSGDGVLYGRSLSVHGDCGYLEVISTALKHGQIPQKDIPRAIAYSLEILRKTTGFWYDKKCKSFNLWFDGRTTNAYRQSRRLLEVNLDMANHLLTTLDNFYKAGYADYETDFALSDGPYKFGNPYKVVFTETPGNIRALYNFIWCGKLVQLPLINAGNMSRCAAYLPFPAIAGKIEAPPEFNMPFLVPEFSDGEGNVYQPCWYYESITDENKNGVTKIVARGKVAKKSDEPRVVPAQSGYNFENTYIFSKDRMDISYTTDIKDATFRIEFAYPKNAGISIALDGCETHSAREVSGDKNYFTPHGASDTLEVWEGKASDIFLSLYLT